MAAAALARRCDHHAAVAFDIHAGGERAARIFDVDAIARMPVVPVHRTGRAFRHQRVGQRAVLGLQRFQAGDAVDVVAFGGIGLDHEDAVGGAGRYTDGVGPALEVRSDLVGIFVLPQRLPSLLYAALLWLFFSTPRKFAGNTTQLRSSA